MSQSSKPDNPTNLFGASGTKLTEAAGLQSATVGDGSRTREVSKGPRKLGKALDGVDPRKWGNFDMARGIQNATDYEVGRNDRLSAADAGKARLKIMKGLGVETETEGVQLTVMRAMFYAHAVNSASVLQPERAFMEIEGTRFKFIDVVDILGTDQRRFFRAFADEVRLELRRILDTYDPGNYMSREKVAAIKEVAVDRGMQRHPDLISDSAIGCTDLTMTQLAALGNSKKIVLPTSINAADAMAARANPVSADQYDSTNHARVPGASGDRAGRS